MYAQWISQSVDAARVRDRSVRSRRATVHLLVSEDALRAKLAAELAGNGFLVSAFADASSFYRASLGERCDIAVIDISVAGDSALSIVALLRRTVNIGIVVLTGADAVETRLKCFEHGADSCLVKPCDSRELIAHLRALHRRIDAGTVDARAARGRLATLRRRLETARPGSAPSCRSRRRSAHSLRCLFQASGEPVSRAELISRLGGDPQSADPHRVDVLVNRLRRKAAAFGMQLPLHSVRGKGYTLTTDSVRTDDDLVLAPQPDPAATTFDGFAPRPRPWTPASPRRAWHEPSPRPPASMVSRRPRPL